MSSSVDSKGPPMFLVAGRTRIGKGEFISTTNLVLEGSFLPGIVSDSVVSHTREAKGYCMRLGNREVEMVDTVGFDDSSGTNIPEETLLRFLEKSGKADFYPPLVILQTLSAMEKSLLQKMSAVFPEIVVAFRSEDDSRLNRAQRDIESACTKKPVEVFHLQGFVPEKLDGGNSRRLYANCVLNIVRFYETLTPSRKELDFSSPLFAGKYERTPYRTETKTEDVEKSHVETRSETKTVSVPKTEVDMEDAKLHGVVGGSMAGAGAITAFAVPPVGLTIAACGALQATCGVIFGRKEKTVHVDEQKNFDVNFTVKEKIRRTFVREVKEVWKVLAGDIRIFEDYEYGQWKIVDETVQHRSEHRS